jgi:hypothetical protein
MQKQKPQQSLILLGFLFELVAGARNHQNLWSARNCSVEAASLGLLASRVQMIAGAGNGLKLLFRAVA